MSIIELIDIQFIICAYNNEDIIKQCIESINSLILKPGWNILITVVDDCSSDHTMDIVKSMELPNIMLKYLNQPTGPSVCKNEGMFYRQHPACAEYSSYKPDYIFFCDSDIILSNDCLIRLMDSMADGADICGPSLYLPDGIVHNGGGITRAGYGYDIILHGKVMYICSAAMLVRRKVIDTIGVFDDTFFYGHEDTDFCWRALLAGYNIRHVPLVFVKHLKSFTVKNKQDMIYYHATKNRFMSIIKNYNLFHMMIYGTMYMTISFTEILFRHYRKERLRAWYWCLKNIRQIIKKRRFVQSLRQCSDSELPFTFIIRWS